MPNGIDISNSWNGFSFDASSPETLSGTTLDIFRAIEEAYNEKALLVGKQALSENDRLDPVDLTSLRRLNTRILNILPEFVAPFDSENVFIEPDTFNNKNESVLSGLTTDIVESFLGLSATPTLPVSGGGYVYDNVDWIYWAVNALDLMRWTKLQRCYYSTVSDNFRLVDIHQKSVLNSPTYDDSVIAFEDANWKQYRFPTATNNTSSRADVGHITYRDAAGFSIKRDRLINVGIQTPTIFVSKTKGTIYNYPIAYLYNDIQTANNEFEDNDQNLENIQNLWFSGSYEFDFTGSSESSNRASFPISTAGNYNNVTCSDPEDIGSSYSWGMVYHTSQASSIGFWGQDHKNFIVWDNLTYTGIN